MASDLQTALVRGLRAAVDPASIDVFRRLRYEPACAPRVAAARAAGHDRPLDAQDAGVPLPAPCGECPQERFHRTTAHAVLYGGALGGGKTKALLMEGIRAAVQYRGIRIGAFRRTFDELAESFLAELAKVDFGEALGASWNRTTRVLTFPNRSQIRFRYVETLEDASRRQGGEYQLLLIDEAGLIPADAIGALEERQRSSDPRIPVLGLRLASNPGGVSHEYLKARFIDTTNFGEHDATDDYDRSVAFVFAKATDNPYLGPDYQKQLDAIADPERRRAMRDGDWEVLAGMAFGEWSRERHVVQPFSVPLTWRRICGIDYGYAAPFAAIWIAIDQDYRAWLYRELYRSKVPEREQARMILEAEAAADEDEVYRVMDPAAWGETGTHVPPAVQYIIEGCSVTKAVNDRLSGISRFHTYLRDGPACAHHRALGWETCPMLHVFASCSDWLRTVPMLPRDKNRPEDVDTKAEDHAYDATRYALMSPVAGAAPFLFR